MNDITEPTVPILVCVDGSDEALAATRWAAGYAARIHAPLRLVHTVPDGDWYGSAAFVDGGALEDDLRRIGENHLALATDAAHAVEPDQLVETVIADGTLSDFIATAWASLIVLGSRRRSAARDVLLGSNTIGVLERATGPVLICRPGSEQADDRRPIVVGVDASTQSDRALTLAMDIAHTFGRPLVVANYWGVAAQAGINLGAGYIDWERVRTEEKRWLDAHVSVLHEKYPDVPLTTVSSDRSPGRALTALSADAMIVAVGSRGRGAFLGTLLGSVSQNLLHHAECSVLIVR